MQFHTMIAMISCYSQLKLPYILYVGKCVRVLWECIHVYVCVCGV